jgi:hypothetical protein
MRVIFVRPIEVFCWITDVGSIGFKLSVYVWVRKTISIDVLSRARTHNLFGNFALVSTVPPARMAGM